ncbi:MULTISPECIES: DNA polymerase III subunit gamma/tau [unclassified Cellulophaga]|uniref:DNA polymerase III subunit gamma/tau n=1 Tax=unclassified Cellulophaga TaxID=2634405 RepID=UPI0026E3A9D3|nr:MULTISPECIES: DNA polymerase III subunit gamma/tau [unclassified Cellulophaga]MDO6491421.1 DNA polymerase III subunit gamma/tau [Cellulophaga sp. 2_MG-2023]MDO6493298.1 DNA polymerase III subunit gamma/tau [Cellulophaga sp. 3_MG-2023]
MEPFVVSARKYRPQTFKDVVGQQAITNTLLNAIQNNHLAQALLFTGPRGVGKTTCARILAKMINSDGEENSEEDFAFNIFELDAASNNSVDGIRSLIDQVRIPPQVGKYKVYIIDEVHMLSQAAFNAFLKTLEEPPKHAIFILATTEKHKIIPTILSRCQIFDFKRITVKDAAEYLKYIAENQGIEADDDALHIIAQKADGAMRDALSIFDRVVSFSGKQLTRKAVTENLNVLDYDTYFTATDYILQNDIPSLLILFNTTLSKGFDGHHFIIGLASHFRDLMVCKHPNTINLLEVGDEAKKRYLEQTQQTNNAFLLKAIDIANSADLDYKTSKNQRLLIELALMKLASITFDGEKKNPESLALHNQIISLVPASHFRKSNPNSTQTTKAKESTPSTEQATVANTTTETAPVATPKSVTPTVVSKTNTATAEVATAPAIKKLDINAPKRVSGLSLSSLKAKQQHKLNKVDVVVDESKLPNEDFAVEKLQELWNIFVNKIEAEGQRILASNLNSDTPTLKDRTTISIQLPNDTMKKEVEREKYDLMEYLKKELNNYFITLEVTVNEEAVKKFAFTPEEKYQKLREKNPVIDLLRQEFDLSI